MSFRNFKNAPFDPKEYISMLKKLEETKLTAEDKINQTADIMDTRRRVKEEYNAPIVKALGKTEEDFAKIDKKLQEDQVYSADMQALRGSNLEIVNHFLENRPDLMDEQDDGTGYQVLFDTADPTRNVFGEVNILFSLDYDEFSIPAISMNNQPLSRSLLQLMLFDLSTLKKYNLLKSVQIDDVDTYLEMLVESNPTKRPLIKNDKVVELEKLRDSIAKRGLATSVTTKSAPSLPAIPAPGPGPKTGVKFFEPKSPFNKYFTDEGLSTDEVDQLIEAYTEFRFDERDSLEDTLKKVNDFAQMKDINDVLKFAIDNRESIPETVNENEQKLLIPFAEKPFNMEINIYEKGRGLISKGVKSNVIAGKSKGKILKEIVPKKKGTLNAEKGTGYLFLIDTKGDTSVFGLKKNNPGSGSDTNYETWKLKVDPGNHIPDENTLKINTELFKLMVMGKSGLFFLSGIMSYGAYFLNQNNFDELDKLNDLLRISAEAKFYVDNIDDLAAFENDLENYQEELQKLEDNPKTSSGYKKKLRQARKNVSDTTNILKRLDSLQKIIDEYDSKYGTALSKAEIEDIGNKQKDFSSEASKLTKEINKSIDDRDALLEMIDGEKIEKNYKAAYEKYSEFITRFRTPGGNGIDVGEDGSDVLGGRLMAPPRQTMRPASIEEMRPRAMPAKAKGRKPSNATYMLKNGMFGDLEIDVPHLFNKLQLKATRGGAIVYDSKADTDTIDLLTKRYNKQRVYSPLAQKNISKLISMSNMIPAENSAKLKMAQKYVTAKRVKKGEGIANVPELDELIALCGSYNSGNHPNQKLQNQILSLSKKLLNSGHLDMGTFKEILNNYT